MLGICALSLITLSCNRVAKRPPGRIKAPLSVKCSSATGCIDCYDRIGNNNDVCLLPLSWLKGMAENHPPILVHHKDVLVWIGDGGENLNVSDLTGAQCDNEHQPDNNAPPKPTEIPTDNGTPVVYASVKADKGYEKHCYKHNIDYGGSSPLDPHVYVGDQ